MESNFNSLLERIIQANKSNAYTKVKKIMQQVDGNIAVVGAGGSFSVADYISRCLKGFAISLRPREMLLHKTELLDYVILVTYSGKTPDIVQCINHCKKYDNIKKIIVITWDEGKFAENVDLSNKIEVIAYKNNDTSERSFISIASTLAPVSLFARHSIEADGKEFYSYIEKLLHSAEKEIDKVSKENVFDQLKYKPFLEVIYESETKSSAAMLESNLIEKGISYIVMHEKKDFSHGRYNLQYSKKAPILVWLKNSRESLYDKALLEYLNKNYKDTKLVIIKSTEGKVIGELEVMIKSMYLSKMIAENVGEDLSKYDYPNGAVGLYRFDRDLI